MSGVGLLRRRLSALGYSYTSEGFDSAVWAPVIATGINAAATVAKVAVAPTPTTSIMYPSGAIATSTAGAPLPVLSSSITGIAGSSELLLLGGLALVAVVMMAR
jgi:hypothetical protein